jgi:hypothetical protein
MLFKVGDWIAHDKFGLGQIATDRDPYFEIRFLSQGMKTLLQAAIVNAAQPPSPDFRFPELMKPRPQGSKPSRTLKSAYTFDHLVERFIATYPHGFEDPHYLVDEREYKDASAARLHKELAAGEMQRLIAAEDFGEIGKRAQRVATKGKMNLIFPNELMKLSAGLKTETGPRDFSLALFQVLYGTGDHQQAFDSYVSVLGTLGCPFWTNATFFQFIATSGKAMFMKPAVCQLIADSVDAALNYQVLPNWLTYMKLQELSKTVEDRLTAADLSPRDGIDVQSFMYVAWAQVQTPKRSSKQPVGLAPA